MVSPNMKRVLVVQGNARSSGHDIVTIARYRRGYCRDGIEKDYIHFSARRPPSRSSLIPGWRLRCALLGDGPQQDTAKWPLGIASIT